MKVTVEVGGGLEMIFGGKRSQVVAFTGGSMQALLEYIAKEVVEDQSKLDVFILDGNVRPGILVLINDSDWELEGELEYEVQDGDHVLFTSTLHGG
ncbi:hypothetical protein CANCADRAFT_106879 [Tortispora caseinolytica NRRL Y-17796]|uniref:Ubiquitin-related modifier 1 n=1 Tax=Tortispora caseinolytica NRRL Y-17796 TaxID=767744 RepID=A0A1E4TFI7_9ASCO|nr:hypothetical protein CANCADRAFT_106879 [Tortispora caseinolytica NRRL Y-17796]